MTTLSQKANDAVLDIDVDEDDDNDDDKAEDIEHETGAETEDDDVQVFTDDKASESRFRMIADSIWSWPRPTANLL